MMFCPKCGSMLKPKVVNDKKVMACNCGYVAEKSTVSMSFGVKKEDKKREMEVEHEKQTVNTIVDEECPKCKNNKAETWAKQMRAGDEPETIFFKCTKCEHTWRER